MHFLILSFKYFLLSFEVFNYFTNSILIVNLFNRKRDDCIYE